MNIEDINQYCRNSFVDYLGIRFTSWDQKSIIAEINIKDHHLQPVGVVHGGVFISLAETLAGAGSALMVEDQGKTAFGTVVNSQHIASATEGKIYGTATLLVKSDFKHIWDVRITDDSGKLISISRVTNSIKELK